LFQARAAKKKIAPKAETDLALSHDVNKLLYTRSDSKSRPRTALSFSTILTPGKSLELVNVSGAHPFWSPDDGRIAFRSLWIAPGRSGLFTPHARCAALFASQSVIRHGWGDNHNRPATDMETLTGSRRQQQQSVHSKYLLSGISDQFRHAARESPSIRTCAHLGRLFSRRPVLAVDSMAGCGFFLYGTAFEAPRHALSRLTSGPLQNVLARALQVFVLQEYSLASFSHYRIFLGFHVLRALSRLQ